MASFLVPGPVVGGLASPVPVPWRSPPIVLQCTVTEGLVLYAVSVWRAMQDSLVRDVPLVTMATP